MNRLSDSEPARGFRIGDRLTWKANMKRFLIGSAFVLSVLTAAVVGFGAGWARPHMLPPWLLERIQAVTTGANPDETNRSASLREHLAIQPASVVEPSPGESHSLNPDTVPALWPSVRLGSADVARVIGLKTAPARPIQHVHHLLANAETAYDTRRYATVTPRVSGFLREVRVDLGQSVKQGEVLAVVDSAEISAAKTQFLSTQAASELAQATYERTKALAQSGQMAARTELESLTAWNQARAALIDAEQRLRNLGLDDPQINQVRESSDKASLLNVVSPIAGSVVQLRAVRGEAVQPTTPLFAIADTSRMWLWIDVYESNIIDLSLNQAVDFLIAGNDTPAASGSVTWMGTEVNTTTRTTRVRAELDNPQGHLRANQFGKARLQVGEPHEAVTIPESAVQQWHAQKFVFLPEPDFTYRPHPVRTRPLENTHEVEIIEGLQPGQKVVTVGAYRLKSELEKDTIAEE